MKRSKDYITSSDRELIGLIKGGDQAAFALIYERYWPAMFSQAYKMLHDKKEAKCLT